MSNLAHEGDDHPDAAAKHLEDACVLFAKQRYDGAGYLAGYVLECTFKTLIILEGIARAGGLSATNLKEGAKEARKHKHHLLGLSEQAAALASLPGAATARYAPKRVGESIYQHGWTESLRYARPGSVGRAVAKAWVDEARSVYVSIATMRRDGVL